MNRHSAFDAVDEDNSLNASWEDGEFIFRRAWRRAADGKRDAVLVVHPAAEHPAPATLDRLAHEYGLKDELDGAWAVRPMEIGRNRGRTVLVLEDFGGEPLDRRVGSPMEVGSFLRLAISIATALGKLHRRGLIHKDLKPAHIMVNSADEQVRLTGFGLASRLPRERQAPEPPEFIAGTLAYMAPEQTGRMKPVQQPTPQIRIAAVSVETFPAAGKAGQGLFLSVRHLSALSRLRRQNRCGAPGSLRANTDAAFPKSKHVRSRSRLCGRRRCAA